MKKLIVPSKLNEGDTVAFISISGGRAGDEDMLPRYLLGKRRFEKIFHVNVVETPHALKGSEYLYEHPEQRAADLMWALKNDSVKGIMLESYLKEGRQDIGCSMIPGLSVTDACLGWKETEEAIWAAYEKLP